MSGSISGNLAPGRYFIASNVKTTMGWAFTSTEIECYMLLRFDVFESPDGVSIPMFDCQAAKNTEGCGDRLALHQLILDGWELEPLSSMRQWEEVIRNAPRS